MSQSAPPAVRHVFRWDLDKTYLVSDFESVRGLLRSATQSAEEKTNIPGTAALIRALKSGPGGHRHRIDVLSGSPRQMRKVLTKKLRLDGACVDSLTLKDNLRNILRGRFRAVKDQLGYKVPALLECRAELGDVTCLETCFGDDSEMDAICYRLYSDLCARRVTGDELVRIAAEARLYPDQVERIQAALERVATHDPVQRILIHLEAASPPGRFAPLGSRVVPTFNTFQSAVVVFGDGHLNIESVVQVTEEMIGIYGYNSSRLRNSLADVLRRGAVNHEVALPVARALGFELPNVTVASRPSDEPTVDYVERLQALSRWRKARRKTKIF